MRKLKNALVDTSKKDIDLGVLNMNPIINLSDFEKEVDEYWEGRNKVIVRCSQTL